MSTRLASGNDVADAGPPKRSAHTFTLPVVKAAACELLADAAEYLVDQIYLRYTDPIIRVGLTIRILMAHTRTTIKPAQLDLVLEDVTELLRATTDPTQRAVYMKEYRYLQGLNELTDILTLNDQPL
jgi:hypothetical protein